MQAERREAETYSGMEPVDPSGMDQAKPCRGTGFGSAARLPLEEPTSARPQGNREHEDELGKLYGIDDDLSTTPEVNAAAVGEDFIKQDSC